MPTDLDGEQSIIIQTEPLECRKSTESQNFNGPGTSQNVMNNYNVLIPTEHVMKQ